MEDRRSKDLPGVAQLGEVLVFPASNSPHICSAVG